MIFFALLLNLVPSLNAQGLPVDVSIFEYDTVVYITITDDSGNVLGVIDERLNLKKIKTKTIGSLSVKPPFFGKMKEIRTKKILSDSVKTESIVDSIIPLLFCGGVDENKPVGVSDRFFLEKSEPYVYAYYGQDKALALKSVRMIISKSEENHSKIQVSEGTFTVKPKWNYTIIKCFFPGAGSYEVSLFDETGRLLSTGTVSIVLME